MLTPKLINFITNVQFWSLFIGTKINQRIQYKIIPKLTNNSFWSSFLSSVAKISSTNGQLVQLLLSHLVTLSISPILKLLVDFSTILPLLHGTLFLQISIISLIIILQQYLLLLYLLSSTKHLSLPVPLVFFSLDSFGPVNDYLRCSPSYRLISPFFYILFDLVGVGISIGIN